MAYRLTEIDLTEPLADIPLEPHEEGVGLVARWQGRLVGFEMIPAKGEKVISAERLARIADQHYVQRILAAKLEDELADREPLPVSVMPGLSIAICTKDRAERLTRLLASIGKVLEGSVFSFVEIIVGIQMRPKTCFACRGVD